ncbi:hypothetical protein [Actinomadura latina]|uniref:TPM domain-containing protein n=1 Tax=Actinomadura latina TaxID=163603 RepID=A0A846YYU9_9ACTN|nr:hypothetical protein [Actinomadura latina]NKZ03972.1 hypothetical protein [Actinomadura latina]
MWRGWFLLIIGVLLACPPAAAAAAPMERAKPAGRADHIAAELRRDPVYVTDHAPRALPEDAAQRIRRAAARLGGPVYVAVTPTLLTEGYDAEELVSLLHDSLNRPGLYIVADPGRPAAAAVQYGGRALPVKDAMRAAEQELPYDAGAVATIERFVDVALSGHARERRENAGPRPKSKVRIALDARDRSEREARRTEWSLFAAGTALSAVTVVLLLVWLRRRRATRAERARAERLKAAEARKTARGKTARGKNQKRRSRR